MNEILFGLNGGPRITEQALQQAGASLKFSTGKFFNIRPPQG